MSLSEWEWDIVAAWTVSLAWCVVVFWTALHLVTPWLVKLRIF